MSFASLSQMVTSVRSRLNQHARGHETPSSPSGLDNAYPFALTNGESSSSHEATMTPAIQGRGSRDVSPTGSIHSASRGGRNFDPVEKEVAPKSNPDWNAPVVIPQDSEEKQPMFPNKKKPGREGEGSRAPIEEEKEAVSPCDEAPDCPSQTRRGTAANQSQVPETRIIQISQVIHRSQSVSSGSTSGSHNANTKLKNPFRRNSSIPEKRHMPPPTEAFRLTFSSCGDRLYLWTYGEDPCSRHLVRMSLQTQKDPPETEAQRLTLSTSTEDEVAAAVQSFDVRVVAGGCRACAVFAIESLSETQWLILFDKNGVPVPTLFRCPERANLPDSLAVSRDDKLVAVGCAGRAFLYSNTDDGLHSLGPYAADPHPAQGRRLQSVIFSRDSSRLLLASQWCAPAAHKNHLYLSSYDVSQDPLEVQSNLEVKRLLKAVRDIEVDPTGGTTETKGIHIFDMGPGQVPFPFRSGISDLRSALLHPGTTGRLSTTARGPLRAPVQGSSEALKSKIVFQWGNQLHMVRAGDCSSKLLADFATSRRKVVKMAIGFNDQGLIRVVWVCDGEIVLRELHASDTAPEDVKEYKLMHVYSEIMTGM